MSVDLTAADASLAATQSITVAVPTREFAFELNAALTIDSATATGASAALTRLSEGRWRARLENPVRQLTLRYSGRPELSSAPLGNYFDRDGAWLSASGGWYARPVGALANTELRVRNDAGWSCLSNGRELSERGANEQHWREPNPQRDLHLACAPFHRYEATDRENRHLVSLQAWLRTPDEALATRYLDAAARQLALFEPLLGPYPYAKFALVENRAQTGFGMASFTLLGDRVIRLPFILNSSFPHELVHNWFGNGVYVDTAAGNWSEGLTTYLSDHGLAERAGNGRAHRRKALMRLSVQTERQAPYSMTQFRARASALDSAIGYDRAMMVFHQLRLELGDDKFSAGLRNLVAQRLFKPTRFDELGRFLAGEDDSLGTRLTALLHQWLERPDLPTLALEQVEVRDGAVHGVVQQTQKGAPFGLRVESVVTLGDGQYVRQSIELGANGAQPFTIATSGKPLRLDIDPGSNALRRLPAGDRARHLAETLAASPVGFIHPDTPAAGQASYQRQAKSLGLADVRVALPPEPLEGAAVLLGSNFRTRGSVAGALAQFASPGSSADDTTCRALALSEGDIPAIWLDCDEAPDTLARFARVLPRYGNRGLVVAGTGPRDRAKAYDAPWPDGSLSVVWKPGTPLPPDASGALLGLDHSPPHTINR